MTARQDDRADIESLLELVRKGRFREFVTRARTLEPADLAEVLAALEEDERLAIVQALPARVSGQALVEMPIETHAEETLAALDPEQAAEIVEQLEDDDAADILGELDPAAQERILSEIEDREDVERLLRYDEETAGGLMTAHVVTVTDSDTAAEALAAIRRQAEEVEDFYQVYVVNAGHRLVGILPLKELVVSPPDRPVREFMERADISVGPEVDQEEVARLMSKYHLPSAPVVDANGRLLGQVTFDDALDVVKAETTEDLLQFGGASADEDIGAGWAEGVRSRLPWLFVNLLTAFVAGAVVYSQQAVIVKVVALAAWMPIIAGMGGNAGTQALAVTVRRLALGLISPRKFSQVVGKEIVVGTINGLAVGSVVAVVATVVGGEGPKLGLVVFLAMVGNLLVAGFAGAFIPLVLQRLRIDPAIASSIFVTTFTDVCGFVLLLGLAALLLL